MVRRPAPSVTEGLRAIDVGAPDFEKVKQEHEAYIRAMTQAGVKVDVLEPLPDFPDAIFVEDPALTFPNGAILLRPGAPSRRGETEHIIGPLRQHFDTVLELPSPGFVEGGDVLRTPAKIMIGLSERTNVEGANGLVGCLEELDMVGEIVETPDDVLHFKTDCSLVDEETVFTTRRLARSGVFKDFKIITVPAGEEAAANALRVNDVVFVGANFPQSIALLTDAGFDVVPLQTTEIGKIDAGLSCMSLRW